MLEAKYVTAENLEVRVHGRVHLIPSVNLRVYSNGEVAISPDEYNKILHHIAEEDKKRSKNSRRLS